MAVLPPPKAQSGFGRFPLPPKGTGIWTCLKIEDLFGVERKRYQSDEMFRTDVTRFLFGTVAPKTKEEFFIQSREMRISADPKSALFHFLRAWLGEAPKIGWDYCELVGRGALITVEIVEATRHPGEMFANIASIGPVLEDLAGKVVPVAKFRLPMDDDEDAGPNDELDDAGRAQNKRSTPF